eukprot:g52614.t1
MGLGKMLHDVYEHFTHFHPIGAGLGVAANLAAGGALLMAKQKWAKVAGAWILCPGSHYVAVAAAGSTVQGFLQNAAQHST